MYLSIGLAGDRARVRAMTGQYPPFVEVHIATPVEECSRRDPKGLYWRVVVGEIRAFTGISEPDEIPTSGSTRSASRRRKRPRLFSCTSTLALGP